MQFKNVVAIVDPPRAGLHPTVSDTLCRILIVGRYISLCIENYFDADF